MERSRAGGLLLMFVGSAVLHGCDSPTNANPPTPPEEALQIAVEQVRVSFGQWKLVGSPDVPIDISEPITANVDSLPVVVLAAQTSVQSGAYTGAVASVHVEVRGRLRPGASTGTLFETATPVQIESAVPLLAAEEVAAGLTQELFVVLDAGKWFGERGDLDPRGQQNRAQIRENISSSMAPIVVQRYQGWAASAVEGSSVEAVAVHQDGTILGAFNSATGAGGVIITPGGERVVFWLDDQQRPSALVLEDHVLLFDNWLNGRVDVAVVMPDGTTEIHRAVAVDQWSAGATDAPTAEYVAASFDSPDFARLANLGRWGRAYSCLGAALLNVGAGAAVCSLQALALLLEAIAEQQDPSSALSGTSTAIGFTATLVGCTADLAGIAFDPTLHSAVRLAHCASSIAGEIVIAADKHGAETIEMSREQAEALEGQLGAAFWAVSGALDITGYAHAPSDLYIVETSPSGQDHNVGRIANPAGTELLINDLAVSPDGDLWVISPDTLYRVDPITLVAEAVGYMGSHGNVNGLVFREDGALFAVTAPYYHIGPGKLLLLDKSNGQATEIGPLGDDWASSGDIAFAPDGTLFIVLDAGLKDLLGTVDLATGTANPVAEVTTGYGHLYGLAFVDDILYGVTSTTAGTGVLITIDPQSGVGEYVRDLKFNGFGANASISEVF